MTYISTIILLVISLILLLSIMYVTQKASKKSQVQKMTIAINLLLINWCIVTIIEETWRKTYGSINMLCVNLIYISICFLPIFIFLFGLSFAKTKVNFSKKYLWLFVIPVITTGIIWTNNYHHCFFDNYSAYSTEATYGWYYFFHSVYSYGLIFIGLYLLLSYSIKNAGLFSRQSILMILGISVPVIVNIAYSFNLMSLTFSINPIAFTIWSFCTAIAVQKFKLLNIIPIALQKVVDCMHDSYFVVNSELELIDYNKSFADKIMKNIEIKKSEFILEHMKQTILNETDYENIKETIRNSINDNKFYNFEQEIKELSKFYNIDINPIISDGQVIGAIALFKDITELKQTQNILVEKERLFTLGELAGGMAHDINTPLSSIATGISYFEETMELNGDSKEIFEAMKRSLDKISTIVNSIRDQIRNTGTEKNEEFIINNLIKNVEMLLFPELKRCNCKINFNSMEEIKLKGDTSKLEQVITNIVLNSVQAYEKEGGIIDIELYKVDNKAIIKIKDSAGGIPEKIAEGLLNQILTTKGSRGTGFGLYFSNSIIKGIFNGNLKFETKLGEGTTFYIEIPINI